MTTKTKRKICVVTGSRAEYGLLYWVMKGIQQDPELELQVLVTGMHLSPEFGSTYKQIESDGFRIDRKVEMLLSSDSSVGISKSVGLGVIGAADALDALKPDLVLVLGDRFEIFAASQAAFLARIPLAHIAGGERTEGVLDESLRHAITKMSQFHFSAAEEYRERIIQMGENPELVFNVGSTGLDNIRNLELAGIPELENELGFRLGDLNFLVTFHPVTLEPEASGNSIDQLLKALDQFPQAHVIFTSTNADTGGRIVRTRIDDYVAKNAARCACFESLGARRYLSVMKAVDVVIGNSSSAIIEAPALKKAVVNIGDRQKGRLRASCIIDTEANETAIADAIRKALSTDFKSALPSTVSLYGDGNASAQIVSLLKKLDLSSCLKKKFFDLRAVSL